MEAGFIVKDIQVFLRGQEFGHDNKFVDLNRLVRS